MTKLPLSEVFGPTFQGEGPYAGRPCSFVRLGLCNLTCEWCDTPYTWDRTRFDLAVECPDTPIDAIHSRLEATGELGSPGLVVLSGGEPFIHQRHFPELTDNGWVWHIETNGTLAPHPDTYDLIGDAARYEYPIQHITVSPKINTRDQLRKRLKDGPLTVFADLAIDGLACFKFVVTDPGRDLPLIEELTGRLGVHPSAVWVMPEGTTPDRVLANHRVLADALLERGSPFSTTTRLHTLLWGDERGH